jgi:phosphoribosylglycinamide formyltransferase-1
MTTVSVLASGRGSNLQAILEHKKTGAFENVDIGVLIYNHPDSEAKKIAGEYQVDARFIEHEKGRIGFYNEVVEALEQYRTDLVCLAGWDMIIGREFFEPYRWRIMNIHPALLPAYGDKGLNGMDVHEAVLKDGTKITGCSVFFTDISVERGPVILQHPVEVGEEETRVFWEDLATGLSTDQNRGVQLLADRVLIWEHRSYAKAIQLFVDGKLRVQSHLVKESRDGEKHAEERAVVMIDHDRHWDERWNERQKTFILNQKKQWMDKGKPTEVLLFPQP